MAKKEIKTSIIINSTPEKVWSILSDTANYPSWNPFIKSIKGDFVVGKTIVADIDGMTFKPEVLVVKQQKEIRWIGRLFFKGIFDGEHSFHIDDNKDGSVTFRQEEKFNGILVGMFSKKLDTDTKSGFEAMNEALKALAEA